jgi:hypothetical protein
MQTVCVVWPLVAHVKRVEVVSGGLRWLKKVRCRWLLVASGGLRWPQVASGGLRWLKKVRRRWLLVAFGGLWWPLVVRSPKAVVA